MTASLLFALHTILVERKLHTGRGFRRYKEALRRELWRGEPPTGRYFSIAGEYLPWRAAEVSVAR